MLPTGETRHAQYIVYSVGLCGSLLVFNSVFYTLEHGPAKGPRVVK